MAIRESVQDSFACLVPPTTIIEGLGQPGGNSVLRATDLSRCLRSGGGEKGCLLVEVDKESFSD